MAYGASPGAVTISQYAAPQLMKIHDVTPGADSLLQLSAYKNGVLDAGQGVNPVTWGTLTFVASLAHNHGWDFSAYLPQDILTVLAEDTEGRGTWSNPLRVCPQANYECLVSGTLSGPLLALLTTGAAVTASIFSQVDAGTERYPRNYSGAINLTTGDWSIAFPQGTTALFSFPDGLSRATEYRIIPSSQTAAYTSLVAP